jgi:hypothetical protein
MGSGASVTDSKGEDGKIGQIPKSEGEEKNKAMKELKKERRREKREKREKERDKEREDRRREDGNEEEKEKEKKKDKERKKKKKKEMSRDEILRAEYENWETLNNEYIDLLEGSLKCLQAKRRFVVNPHTASWEDTSLTQFIRRV